TEISPKETQAQVEAGEAILFDVREASEFAQEHAPGARHASRGTIDIKIEKEVPDLDQPIICHCGGGGRSALVADNLQKMGYTNVKSMAGGMEAWKEAGLPTVTD
ncbi:MAG: rhodanese-like domain-containing protein, partial [Chthoniobacterales bacterium]